MKLALAVPGRFYAFDLARALLRQGHDVTLLTNYPKFLVRRWGIPAERVRCFVSHGLVTRVAHRWGIQHRWEACLQQAFGRWVARQISQDPPQTGRPWDAVALFSGIAEECLAALRGQPVLTVVKRASAHIAVQRQLLDEEEARGGQRIDKPSDWIVAREQREYAAAHIIEAVSSFVVASFRQQGFAEEGFARAGGPPFVAKLLLGVDTAHFRAPADVLTARCQRLRAGEPLRLLYVGNFSAQKGAYDWPALLAALPPARFAARVVGSCLPEAKAIREQLRGRVEFVGHVPQDQLPLHYAWGDIFVFPTIQDGFPVVLAQALAGGLPVLSTPHGSAPDVLEEGKTGWIVPIRRPDLLAERLLWADSHRARIADMVGLVAAAPNQRDWAETATVFVNHVRQGRQRLGFASC